MKKYYFIMVSIFMLSSGWGEEVKDFWDAKNCVFHDAGFSEDENSFIVDYTVVRTPEGTAVGNQFCMFDGNKEMFTPLSYNEPTRLDDKRLSVEAPRTVKMLYREVERAKDVGERQRALEYGYFVPIFMDVIFPQITKYAEPPKAIFDALTKEGVIYDIVYPVEVSTSDILVSSIVATRKPGEKPGTSLEENKRWSGGAFGISWTEVLPEQFKGGVYFEGTPRATQSQNLKKIRIDYKLLDSLCTFPKYIPGQEEGEMDRWSRKASPYIISNFAWKKDMFNSFMEVGFFASFFAKFIFPRIQAKVELPDRFKREGYTITYFTEADINGVTIWATAEGLDEKWKGKREIITWNDALPENIKNIKKD